jgi:hypothetical protein
MVDDTLAGLEIAGLEIPSGPIRAATAHLIGSLLDTGRLEVEHEPLVQLLLRTADAMDRAGTKAVYALPALSKEFREIRAELLDATRDDSAASGLVTGYDVTLIPVVDWEPAEPAALDRAS